MTAFELILTIIGITLCLILLLAGCVVTVGVLAWLFNLYENCPAEDANTDEKQQLDNSEFDYGHNVKYEEE